MRRLELRDRIGAAHPGRTRLLACAVLLALPLLVQAQAAPVAAQAVPRGFRGISLGMEIEQVKTLLRADPLFGYRGDPDVSFLPQTSQYLIECAGNSYLKRAYFQFQDSRLLTMILVLDPQRLDHYSLFSALSTKYGPPTSLDPRQSVWESDAVRFSLERPLTVKYIDQKAFAALVKGSPPPSDLDRLSREKFVEQF